MVKRVLAAALATSVLSAAAEVPRRWTPEAISSDRYESSPSFTPDGREMFFMRADKRFGNYRLMWSRCERGSWSAPVEPPFAAAPGVLEADPFVTYDGKRVYYVSSRPVVNGEDLDIWYVDRLADGRFGEPRRLPEPVNSKAAELLPRVTEDGRIYFGSSRPGGLGQGDIYVATPRTQGSWDVANVGAPVNTPAFEYEAEVSRDGRTLVLVANRGERSHLYRFWLQDGRWVEKGLITADKGVFQVGPLLSPKGDRLLFAQAEGERSGEIFLVDLEAGAGSDWPPRCPP
jgi:Tol biopolymer transport system component